MTEHDRVAGERAGENRRRLIAGCGFDDFRDFGVEGGEHRIAGGHFWLLGFAFAVEHGERRDLERAAGEDGEIEIERGFFEVNFEAVSEGAALLIDDAAGGGDDERGIGELELADAVFDDVAAHPSLARDGRRHAEEQPDEVGVVNVQIDERPADFFGDRRNP